MLIQKQINILKVTINIDLSNVSFSLFSSQALVKVFNLKNLLRSYTRSAIEVIKIKEIIEGKC
jgi:hypothetical protein